MNARAEFQSNVEEEKQFTLGPYTVRIRVRPDNPAFGAYVVMRGEEFIGRSFSRPSLSDCDWLARENCQGTLYASVTVWKEPKLRGRALRGRK